MARVLVPITDLAGAQLALAQLLAEPTDPHLSVHLLAAVEPLRPGKVRGFVTAEEAVTQVRDAARRWLAPLEAMLDAARIPYTSEIVVGPSRTALRAATAGGTIDRVLLPGTAAGRFKFLGSSQLPANRHHPVTPGA